MIQKPNLFIFFFIPQHLEQLVVHVQTESKIQLITSEWRVLIW